MYSQLSQKKNIYTTSFNSILRHNNYQKVKISYLYKIYNHIKKIILNFLKKFSI